MIWFPLKLVAITLFVDLYLYILHRAFHSEMFPSAFRNLHMRHHKDFSATNTFALHPIEFFLDFLPGAIFVTWLVGWWFVPVVTFWAWFEASRGHGHYLWFKIPKAYYRAFGFCGIKYHMLHHTPGHEHENMGQMLKICDRLFGTMSKTI